MWLESEAAQRMRDLYPPGGSPWFHTGHVAYVQAVTTTLIARGIEVSALRLSRIPPTHETGFRAAAIELGPAAWAPVFPASPIPLSLHWNDAFGWNYVINDPANNGMVFGPGQDMILRSRGLGPHVSLVADPHHVAEAVIELLSGKRFGPVGWTGRDPAVQDVALETALAAYRHHPGAVALGARHDQYLISRDVLLHLDAGLLADLARRPDDFPSAALAMRAAQVQVTTTRYEVDPIPDGAAGSRYAAQYRVFVELVDAAASRWVVMAGQADLTTYLSADGQQTTQQQTYDLHTALTVARQAAVQRREGIFAMTADQLIQAHTGSITHTTVTAMSTTVSAVTASGASAAAAWSTTARQSLVAHAARQAGVPAPRPTGTSREHPEPRHAER